MTNGFGYESTFGGHLPVEFQPSTVDPLLGYRKRKKAVLLVFNDSLAWGAPNATYGVSAGTTGDLVRVIAYKDVRVCRKFLVDQKRHKKSINKFEVYTRRGRLSLSLSLPFWGIATLSAVPSLQVIFLSAPMSLFLTQMHSTRLPFAALAAHFLTLHQPGIEAGAFSVRLRNLAQAQLLYQVCLRRCVGMKVGLKHNHDAQIILKAQIQCLGFTNALVPVVRAGPSKPPRASLLLQKQKSAPDLPNPTLEMHSAARVQTASTRAPPPPPPREHELQKRPVHPKRVVAQRCHSEASSTSSKGTATAQSRQLLASLTRSESAFASFQKDCEVRLAVDPTRPLGVHLRLHPTPDIHAA